MIQLAGLMLADCGDFVTRPVARLQLTFAGIAGDRHAGALRPSDSRTTWHPRGTPIANTRQLSIVSQEECAEIALLLDLPSLDPVLLGANLVIAGLPRLSLLPPSTRLQFPSGATVFVTEQNAPCRGPAERIAAAHGQSGLASGFARAAIGRRGLVALVEAEGEIHAGDTVRWIKPPAAVSAPKLPVPELATVG